MYALSIPRTLAALALAGASLTAAAGETPVRERRYQLGDQGVLTLHVPTGWRDSVRDFDGARPAALSLIPEDGAPFEVVVTPIPPLSNDAPIPTPEWVEEQVVDAARAVREQSVESELVIRRISGHQAFGAFFAATDREPGPGEYRYLVQGMLSFGELAASFEILTNDGQEEVTGTAMEMLKQATFRSIQ